MKITFLGTGTSQGVPVIACNCPTCISKDAKNNRLRSSIMIEVNENILVIDAGPDFRQQMLREKVEKLDAILITHEHKDHVGGLDDIRSFNYITKKPMEIYGNEGVKNALEKIYPYVFAKERHPGIPQMNINIVNGVFKIRKTKIIPISVKHHQLMVLAYRISNFAYITDTNEISENSLLKLKNLDILVINALHKKKHISHFNLEEALNIIEILKPKKAYLNHISHMMGLHEDVQKELPDNVHIAYDGLSIDLI